LRLDQVPAVPIEAGVTAPDSSIILSADPLLDRLVEVVEGELPGPIVADEPIPIVLTPAVADAFGWPLGQVRAVHYSAGDRELRLVGLVSARDPSAGEWDHAGVALQPEVIDNVLSPPTFVGVGYADAASISALEGLAAASRFETWLPVTPASLDADDADATVAALRRLSSTPHTVPLTTDWGSWDVDLALTGTTASIITATGPLLAGVSALHAAVASGAALAALAVLALAVRALVARRRGFLRLVAARGASHGARAGALALGVGALTLLGAVPAVAVVAAAAGGPPLVATLAAVGLVAFAAGAAALDATVFERAGARPDDSDRRRSRTRNAIDAGIAVLAGASVLVVVLTPAGARAAPPPLAVLLPALTAAAGCVLALRLVPLVLRAFETLARRSRGLVALLGPARAGRDATTGIVPVLALVIAVTIAVLGSGLLATVERGVDDATRAQVGADVRVDARYLGAADIAEVREASGVRATAVVAADPDIRIDFPDGEGRITVFVLDPAEFAEASTSRLTIPDAGALVSQTVGSRLAGDALEVDGVEVPIVAVVPDDGPFGRASAWIAVSPGTAEELRVDARSRALLVATVPADRTAVHDALADRFAAAGTVRTIDEVLADRRGAPAVRALIAGTAIAVVAAAALTVLATLLALTAGAAGRARVFGLLRALGAPVRAEYPLVLWELVPALIVAVPLGVAAGLVLLPLLAGAGDLTVFTGGSTQPAIVLGLGTSAAVVAALLGVVILGVLLAAAVARRSGASRAVRSIDEEG
jgi:putative ABC transport system permease protein